MPRYVAFLRGVSPMNASMAELRKRVESAGFTDVKTVLASGNVVFNARSASNESLQKKIEAAIAAGRGRPFSTIIRSVELLESFLEEDPFAQFKLPAKAKKVITFLREANPNPPALPIKRDDVFILTMSKGEVFSAYVHDPKKGPIFMQMLEKNFGKNITTRTLDTVKKCVSA